MQVRTFKGHSRERKRKMGQRLSMPTDPILVIPSWPCLSIPIPNLVFLLFIPDWETKR
jgi:hypothetical protein